MSKEGKEKYINEIKTSLEKLNLDLHEILNSFMFEFNDERTHKEIEQHMLIVLNKFTYDHGEDVSNIKIKIKGEVDGCSVSVLPGNLWTGLLLNKIYMPYIFIKDNVTWVDFETNTEYGFDNNNNFYMKHQENYKK